MVCLQYPLDLLTLRQVIKAYVRIDRVQDAERLHQELTETEKAQKDMWSPPDVIILGQLVHAWAVSDTVDKDLALQRASGLFDQIIETYEKFGPLARNVDSWVFEEVARLWARSRQPNAAQQITHIINQMETLSKMVPGAFHPTHSIYVLALDAWAMSKDRRAGVEASKLIKRMRQLSSEGHRIKPNVRSLSSAIVSLSKSNRRGSSAAVERLFDEMLALYNEGDRSDEIQSKTVTTVFSSILADREDSSSDRALRIFNKLVSTGNSGHGHLVPNTISCNCLLNGMARRKEGNRAWNVFERMKAMKPDTTLYNALLHWLSKLTSTNPDAVVVASELVEEMESSKFPDSPNLETYTSLARAIARSGVKDSASRGKKLLRRVQAMAEDGLVENVDFSMYYNTLHAMIRGKSEAGLAAADELLDEICGDSNLKPTTQMFNVVMTAYASTRLPDKVEKVTSLFRRLRTLHDGGNSECEPNVCTFNAVSECTTISSLLSKFLTVSIVLGHSCCGTFQRQGGKRNTPEPRIGY